MGDAGSFLTLNEAIPRGCQVLEGEMGDAGSLWKVLRGQKRAEFLLIASNAPRVALEGPDCWLPVDLGQKTAFWVRKRPFDAFFGGASCLPRRIFIIWAISSWFRRGPAPQEQSSAGGTPRAPSRNLFPKDTLMVILRAGGDFWGGGQGGEGEV